MAVFDFNETVRLIRQTARGRERNMYSHLRDLFAHVLGHASENIIIDSPQEGAGGNSPDLVIRCDTGLINANGSVIYHDWIVVEAKDENVFADDNKRAAIFHDKQKYIRPETEWFVMIDPECLVVRPIAIRNQIAPDTDRVIKWEDLSVAEAFREALSDLCADHVADSPALKRFREGDESRIAVVKVDVPDSQRATLSPDEAERLELAKKDFLAAVRTGIEMLQGACRQALTEWAQEIADITRTVDEFEEQWGGYELTYDPLVIKGKRKIDGTTERQMHEAQVRALREKIKKNPAVAKLAASALPAYRRRSGNQSDLPFALESANLILARILLLRFFEDHNFFGNTKYVCNGGVAALQQFMRHNNKGYTVVLREAYEKGGEIYDEAFDETDLDWVLNHPDRSVSRAIEMAMMLLSRFNFATISGDILTGIYDRFLDREQRKAMGEFYTPPSIARYIIQRLNLKPDDSVFDPACGSGTFLLEAFNHMTNGDVASGRGDYAQATGVLANINGNDINPFSAVMAQIQILWQLLPLKADLKKHDFPRIRVTRGVNAIIAAGDLHTERGGNLYADLDQPTHSAVIGNPPYVRPERSGDMDAETQAFYQDIGGANKNFYDLFVYKALTKWCRDEKNGGTPGRLGFVLPLSFCDSKNSARLRRLFAPGGRFRLLEITDMEIIAPSVFDAAVNPIVLLAENRPATATDQVTLRVAGDESIVGEHEFDLSRAPESCFNYADIFDADGRILTKLHTGHKRIIDKMRRHDTTLADIARVYYVGIGERNRIEKWRDTPPETGGLLPGGVTTKRENLRWEERRMLGMGAEFRSKWQIAKRSGGLDYYKGENISACRVEGEAAKQNVLPDSVDGASFWRYRDILPPVGYAFLRISLGITAARFNPHECAFLNTATLLFPNTEWQDFPLDIALTSHLFQFYFACYLREGAMSHSLRSHIYPRTLEKIPLPPALLAHTDRLTELREEFLHLSEVINRRADALATFLRETATDSLKNICRAENLPIQWSDGLRDGNAVKIDMPTLDSSTITDDRLYLGDEWLVIADDGILRRLAAALITQHGRELKKENLQQMPIPLNARALAEFEKEVRRLDAGAYDEKLAKVFAEIDAIVGSAFGLSTADITYVQQALELDNFLRNIRPRMPFVERRRRGLSDALADPRRYQRK